MSSARHILIASIRLMVVVVAARGMSACKDVVVSRSFGTSTQLDAFLAAYGIMGFLGSAISGAAQSALVPMLTGPASEAEENSRRQLVTATLVAAVLGPGTVAFVALLLRAPLIALTVPGFAGEQAALTRDLLVPLAFVPPLATVQAVLFGTLNARYGFRAAASTTAITPILICAILLASSNPQGAHLAWGTAAGLALEILTLSLLARRAGVSLARRGSLDRVRQELSRFGSQFFPLLAGTALSSTSPIVDQAFASASGSGSLAILNYAGRITALAIGLGITTIGSVALPHFSALAAARAWTALSALLKRVSAATFALSLVPTLGVIIFSESLVRLLFQRGHFVESDTIAVARAQAFYALQIPFHLTGILSIRALQALQRSGVIFGFVGLNVAANFVADYVCTRWFGVAGIALSSSLMYMLSCASAFTFAMLELKRRAQLQSPEPLDSASVGLKR